MRKYVKNKRVRVGYLTDKDNMFHGVGYMTSLDMDDLVDATDEEIEAFERKEKERQDRRLEMHKKEKELLSLCGLSHNDFVRFRNVYKYENKLHVETRENGVGGRSVDAIRNENYITSHADSFDSTYEYYQFNIPE